MERRRVDLFVPCLVDRFLPEIGEATVQLLARAGVDVNVDVRQTCCGQPAFNGGYPEEALPFCRQFLKVFSDERDIVAPSGSCVSMVRDNYGLAGLDESERPAWQRLRRRIFELSEYLDREELLASVQHTLHARAVVHHSCHHLRKAGGETPLYRLLGRISELTVLETGESRACCGFGGVFSAKLPELSIAMARRRLEGYLACNPDLIVLADAGCILQLRGVLATMGLRPCPPVVHYAQLFAVRSAEELVDAAG